MCWILLNFLPQLAYHDSQALRFLTAVGTPHSLQQALMGNRFPLMYDQKAKDLELFGSQMHSYTADDHRSFFEVDTQFGKFNSWERLFRVGPPLIGPRF